MAKNFKNGSILGHWLNKIGNRSFLLKNIDISLKNMSKASKLRIWPK